MHHWTLPSSLLTLSLIVTGAAAMSRADPAASDPSPSESIPSYRAALEAFQAEQAKTGGARFSAQDRAVMERAARDLAATLPEPGLAVGQEAPDFTLRNAFGEPVRLHDLLAEGPVVLTFYRGAWCPYCNLQLHGLQQALPAIERQGAALVAVTPQQPDRSRAQVEEDGYPFEILSDVDDSVMQAYNLAFEVPADLSEIYQKVLSLDLADYNGDGRYVLPVPATFVIDRAGIIRAAFADVDYRRRVEPADILAALEALPTP
ncbi:peroxiredoxin-like family protein [Thiocapsa sp.]|uniref:peroxiredoxin-like family protein n=1 Tax=Thiocapsa sp. TaxID=2024551 RepID=UPI0035935C1A